MPINSGNFTIIPELFFIFEVPIILEIIAAYSANP